MAVKTQAIFGVVQREGMEKGFWTRVGTALQNHDGSWNLRFDYVPTDRTATVQMRPVKAAEGGRRERLEKSGQLRLIGHGIRAYGLGRIHPSGARPAAGEHEGCCVGRIGCVSAGHPEGQCWGLSAWV